MNKISIASTKNEIFTLLRERPSLLFNPENKKGNDTRDSDLAPIFKAARERLYSDFQKSKYFHEFSAQHISRKDSEATITKKVFHTLFFFAPILFYQSPSSSRQDRNANQVFDSEEVLKEISYEKIIETLPKIYIMTSEEIVDSFQKCSNDEIAPSLRFFITTASKSSLQSAFLRASEVGYTLMVSSILHHRRNQEIVGFDLMRALRESSKNGHLPVVRLLVPYALTMRKMNNYNLQLAFSHAADGGHKDLITFFLEKAEGIKIHDDTFDIAFGRALSGGHLSVVQYLLSHKRASAITQKQVRESLFLACGFGHYSVVKYLMEHSATRDVTSRDIGTALWHASANNLKLVKYFFSHKKGKEIVSRDIESAIKRASKFEKYEIKTFLLGKQEELLQRAG